MPDANITTAQRWLRGLRLYTRPRMLMMLILSIVAGQQNPLLSSTLQAWFHNADAAVSTITQLTWIGAFFSLKFLWAPLLDNVKLPFLHRLFGKRRSWLLLCEMGIMLGLLGMALYDPHNSRVMLVLFASVAAFSAATHDIALDAYRIELSSAADEQAALSSVYTIGYRLGMLVGGASALLIGDRYGWSTAYTLMAAIVAVGMITVLVSKPPHSASSEENALPATTVTTPQPIATRVANFLSRLVIQPMTVFFQRYKALGILLLMMICVYRLSDQTMGTLAMPLYQEAGFSLEQIGSVTKFFGVMMTLLGGVVGSILTTRYGIYRLLIGGTLLASVTNLMYILIALGGTAKTMHYSTPPGPLGGLVEGAIAILLPLSDALGQLGVTPIMRLMATIAVDNLASGIAGTVLVGFLASLTSRQYTATQSALFTSLMLTGKFVGGFSGAYAEHYGYPTVLLMSTLLGAPALILTLIIYAKRQLIQQRAQQHEEHTEV